MRIIIRILRSALLLSLAAVSISLPATGHAVALRVGIYDQPPDIYITPEGRPGGILGEMLGKIAEREGWTLTLEACDWAACMHQLESGEIDLLPDVFYTAERARTIDFHHIPALHSWSQIYAAKGNALHTIQDLHGKRLAVLAGSAQYDYLSGLLPTLGIGAQLQTVNQLTQGFQLVQAGQADGVVADYFFGELTYPKYQLVPTPIIFQPTKAFFAAPKGRNTAVLARIDQYLSAWQANPESVYFQILSQWRNPRPQSPVPWYSEWFVVALALMLVFALILAVHLKRRERSQRRRLIISERRLNTILDTVDAMIYIKDRERRYLYANRKVCEFFGLSVSDLVMRRDRELLDDASTADTIEQSDQQVLHLEQRVALQERLTSATTGKQHTFLSIKVPLRNAEGSVEAVCAILTDTTDRVQAEEQVHRLAFYDTLTDLPNRRMLISRLEQALESASSGQVFGALLILDLDNFKKINDTRGHVVGDRILQEVARRLVARTRERDTVSRVSGDEFMVLLTLLGTGIEESARNAMSVAEKLRLALLDDPLVVDGKPSVLSASIGLTLLQARSTSIDDVMREADMAMHRAKERGGNCVVFYEQDIQSEVEQRLWLEHDLTLALNTPQLCMHLQPQYAQGGRVTGAELLTRWNHPTRGAVSPALFIPLAEETGLINHLSDWTLEVACQVLLDLQALDETYPISLNISPKRLMDPNFVQYVRDILERTGAPGNRLIFEITEGVLIRDAHATMQRLDEITRLGIRFSVDDFGTGYSNLASLKRVPLYELKIDKSLVQDIPNDPDSMAIAQLILAMAEQLGLQVVAEGVETQPQADFLFQHDCDALQGYLMARPMPIDAWLDCVRKRRAPS
ncbi:EAL domain-containing protein [Castellaniella sp. GW247-6E4]|uniref:EAL domain-containing protein n=1 Tax=Castellaniella sp. GW247-6E4 TaxID=3140380 RepID=UPI00331482A3